MKKEKPIRLSISLPPPVHKQVTELAEKEKRTVNGQINMLIEEALKKRGH